MATDVNALPQASPSRVRVPCSFCRGKGCPACYLARTRIEDGIDLPPLPQPIFTAQLDDPEDMEALRRTFGVEALEHAFGPEGGGMQEIKHNAAVESIKQLLRKGR